MAALVSRAALGELLEPQFVAELPEGIGDQLGFIVGQAGSGNYETVQLGALAGPVRHAAKQRLTRTNGPAKRVAALRELARIPGY